MNVFIADDSEIIRTRIGEIITDLDNVNLIGCASNVQEALSLLENLEPDVVILDIRMPDGNGMTILNELISRENIPISIIYTSYPYPQFRKAYLGAGATYFFDKANDTPEMVEIIVQLSTLEKSSQVI